MPAWNRSLNRFLRGDVRQQLGQRRSMPRASCNGALDLIRNGLALCHALTVSSPDLRTDIGGYHHRIFGLAPECLGELRHVRQWSVNAELSRRMRIGANLE